MQKATKYSAANTNLANFGTDIEKNIKAEAAKHEAAWKNIGKAPGLEVWRIENFHVVPVDKKSHGVFYGGDSYIVLYTYKSGDTLGYNVHFWLGATTTQDEAGTAAYKTVELDDFLGGKPVQYREVQQYESKLFVSYFPKGIVTLEGGTKSGFHHVDPTTYQSRLLTVTGDKHPRSYEVPLSSDSLNSGDAFILDAGLHIYQWNGKTSTGLEKNRAGQIARALDDERAGKPTVHVIAEGETSADSAAFWKLLGHDAPVSIPATASKTAAPPTEKVLLKVSDAGAATGDVQVTKVGSGAEVTKDKLNSGDVFLLDTGKSVYVWIGKSSSAVEKKHSLAVAQKYLAQNHRPNQSIARVLEGGENEEFNSLFDK